MIKMSRKAKKAMAVALTAGMLASTAATPVMAATQGWRGSYEKGWWYQNADGSYPANKWQKINGVWYYFNAQGYMAVNTWAQDSQGKWYYVGSNGAMKTNAWAQDKAGLWYWLGDTGAMKEGGWVKNVKDGKTIWYFVDSKGVMQSGVIKVDGKTYYLGEANDGSMKTGTVTLEGVNYTFAEPNGDCTSEKLPATTKRFDNKGNLIEDKIEVEEVDGITAEVVSALPQYKEYGNVVMAGNNVTLKVKVTNGGEPVVGTYVTLALKCENSNYPNYSQTTYVAQTGVGGYATFVVKADENLTPTAEDAAEYYTYKVTAAINDSEGAEGSFAVAKMHIPDIDVNPTGANDKLEMSDNAADTDTSCEVTTKAMDGETVITYVKSQQVSLPSQTEHKVTFEIKPEVWIPTGKINQIADDYTKPVNQSISEYSVYESQEFWIEDIPAGLQYTTVHFENIDISEHTKLEIQAFNQDDKTEALCDKVTVEGPSNQKSLGQQLPITKKEKKVAIKVKVTSAGQVNDGQNGGLTIKDVTGVYKQEGTVDVEKIPYTDPVTWEQTKIEYSLAKTMSLAEASYYINDANYLNENYSYSYQVPVFPYVGNAVITVKDNNKKEVAFYTVPTVNDTDSTSATGYKNVNVLDTGSLGEAILVTKDEAFNSVGTITPDGNRVTVNSSETGVTALRAKITIDGKELDVTNNTINTSVHWSPLPSVAQQNDFYALSGQTITVKAQLVDKAGNKVSKAQETIIFSANGEKVEEGDITGTDVTANQIAEVTDTEGCAKLVVQATDTQALLEALTADSTNKNYDVVLHIGDEKVETANLRWVTPGLTFTPTALDIDADDLVLEDPDNGSDMLSTLDENFTGEVSEAYATRYLTKEAGSNWILGFNANGDTQDDEDKERWVSSIQGLKINISQDGEATLVTDGMKNGSAKISSTKANGVEVTGEIDETSVVAGTDVVFTVKTKVGAITTTKDYKNVGEGEPVFEEEVALTLPVLFGTVGTNVSIELPKGESIDSDEDQVVYVKVLDAFENAKEGKLKKVTITYTTEEGTRVTKTYDEETTDEITAPDGSVLAAINADGYVAVKVLREVETESVKKAEIKAEYDNQSDTATINFVEAKGSEFVLLNANYDEANKQATLSFSQNVSNLKSEMIKVTNDSTGNNVGISKVEVKDGNKVVITFKNALKDDYKYTVRVADGVDINEDGIPDTLCDKYGRALKVKGAVLTTEAADLTATYEDDEISFVINGVNGTDEQSILCVWDGGYAEVDGDAGLDVDSVITNKEVTEVKCYYGGAVKTVKLQDRIDAMDAAEDALKEAEIEEPTVTFGDSESVVFDTVDDCNMEVTVNNNIIFADNTGNKTTLSMIATGTAELAAGKNSTVKVTYTNTTYPSITRTVTYTATVKVDAETSTKSVEFVAK